MCVLIQLTGAGNLVIKQKEIHRIDQLLQKRVSDIAIRFKTCVNPGVPRQREELKQKLRLSRRLSAGDSQTTAACLIVGSVAQCRPDYLLGGYGSAYDGQSPRRTNVCACTAACAGSKIKAVPAVREGMCMHRANGFAGPAAGALPANEAQLGRTLKGLRVVTPAAAQLAALEKNGGANAGTVVVGAALNVKNNAHDKTNKSLSESISILIIRGNGVLSIASLPGAHRKMMGG